MKVSGKINFPAVLRLGETHWRGGKVGPGAGLDTMKISCPYWKAIHDSSVIQNVARSLCQITNGLGQFQIIIPAMACSNRGTIWNTSVGIDDFPAETRILLHVIRTPYYRLDGQNWDARRF